MNHGERLEFSEMTNVDPAYQRALDYLYEFIDFSLTRADRYSPERFDLARMHALLARLGDPHRKYPSIHIAGTKGKGSVAALCAHALRDSGHRVGLYTSPHLSDFAERIQIDGQPIDHGRFVSLVDAVAPVAESIAELTTFEIATALAFLHFAAEKIDMAVLEVGLGGRLDATNVVQPSVSVITSISHDHTDFLGERLEQIAAEKAGIIKPGVPVVLAPQQAQVRETVERIARDRAAPLIEVETRYETQPLGHNLDGQSLRIQPKPHGAGLQPSARCWPDEPLELEIPLLGAHQLENAATAYAALETACAQGIPVDRAAIRSGFRSTVWPGRFEVLRRDPPVVVDAAHNRDSAARLRQTLDDYLPDLPVTLIFGASEDKDVEGMLLELRPRIGELLATRSTHPRALEPEQVLELAARLSIPAQAYTTIEQALMAALQKDSAGRVILATGSLFIAAAAREVWTGLKISQVGVK